MRKLLLLTATIGMLYTAQGQSLTQNGSGLGEFNQGLGLSDSRVTNFVGDITSKINKSKIGVDKYKGSPFLNEEFELGTAKIKDKELTGYYRYNVSAQEFEYKQSLSSTSIRALLDVDGTTVTFKTGDVFKYSGNRWYKVDGNIRITYKSKFTQGRKAVTQYQQDTPNRFTIFKDYYNVNGEEIEKMSKKQIKLYKQLKRK